MLGQIAGSSDSQGWGGGIVLWMT